MPADDPARRAHGGVRELRAGHLAGGAAAPGGQRVGLGTFPSRYYFCGRQNTAVQLMTASVAHVTNLTPGSECNPSGGWGAGGGAPQMQAQAQPSVNMVKCPVRLTQNTSTSTPPLFSRRRMLILLPPVAFYHHSSSSLGCLVYLRHCVCAGTLPSAVCGGASAATRGAARNLRWGTAANVLVITLHPTSHSHNLFILGSPTQLPHSVDPLTHSAYTP